MAPKEATVIARMLAEEPRMFLPQDADRTCRIFGTAYLRTSSRAGLGVYALAACDQVARLAMRKREPRALPNLADATIAVAKIDHLGDVMMATPFLAEVRRQLPRARVLLVVGSWCAELAMLLVANGLAADFATYDSWALSTGLGICRSLRYNLSSFRRARRTLAAVQPRCYVDLRPFSPNSLLLAHACGAEFRVGFGLRGLANVLDRVIPFTFSRSFGQLYLDALPLLGLRPATYVHPEPLVGASLDTSGFRLPQSPFLVVQPGSRNPAREAPSDAWNAMLPQLSAHYPIVLLGGRRDAQRYRWLPSILPPDRVVNCMGHTSLSELFSVVQASAGGVTIDSFAAHVLQSYGRPGIVLVHSLHTPRASFPQRCPATDFVARGATTAQLSQAVRRLLQRVAGSTSN